MSASLGSAGSFYFASGWFGRGNILDFWWVGMMAWDGFLCRVVGRIFPCRLFYPTHPPHKQPVGRDFPFPPRRTLLVCVVPAKIFAGDDASLEGSSPRGGKMPRSGGEDRALFTPVTTNA